MPRNVTRLDRDGFAETRNLTRVYFLGDAPTLESTALFGRAEVTLYRRAPATGWPAPGEAWANKPTALFSPGDLDE